MDKEYEDGDSEDESMDSDQFQNISSNVLVAIDCAGSMFQPNSETSKTPFETVIKSLDTVCEALVLKKSSKNKIAICLFHPEEAKRVLLDFDMPFVEGIKNLKQIQKSFDCYSTDDLKPNFSTFILECKKKFNKVPNEGKFMFFITNNGDPSGGDPKIKSLALRELAEVPKINIEFELLPLSEDFDFEPFYAEVYQSLQKTEPKFRYDEECLTLKIEEAIKYKTANRYLRLYLAPNSDKSIYITCAQRSFITEGKINPNIVITKEEPIKKVKIQQERNVDEETFLLEISPQIKKTLTKSEKEKLRANPDINKGLTILKASTKRYSKFGMNVSDPKVLKAKTSSDSNFIALWESCVKENFNLLCTLKYTEFGKVHVAELIPKTINQQRHFLMLTIPQNIICHKIGVQKPEVPPIEDTEPCKEILKLLEYTTIDYEASDMIPEDYLREVDYFKGELFGADYVAPKRKDWVTDKLYDNDVGTLLEVLEREYLEAVKGGKRVKEDKPKASYKRTKK